MSHHMSHKVGSGPYWTWSLLDINLMSTFHLTFCRLGLRSDPVEKKTVQRPDCPDCPDILRWSKWLWSEIFYELIWWFRLQKRRIIFNCMHDILICLVKWAKKDNLENVMTEQSWTFISMRRSECLLTLQFGGKGLWSYLSNVQALTD